MKEFINNFIHHSPSPIIRNCNEIVRMSRSFSRRIFYAAFLSCGACISETARTHILNIVTTTIMQSCHMPVKSSLIGSAEFLERARFSLQQHRAGIADLDSFGKANLRHVL
jgi:hypothetical protein